jgi:hypothetical protein
MMTLDGVRDLHNTILRLWAPKLKKEANPPSVHRKTARFALGRGWVKRGAFRKCLSGRANKSLRQEIRFS